MFGGDLTRQELVENVADAKRALWKAMSGYKKAKKRLKDFDEMGFRSNAQAS